MTDPADSGSPRKPIPRKRTRRATAAEIRDRLGLGDAANTGDGDDSSDPGQSARPRPVRREGGSALAEHVPLPALIAVFAGVAVLVVAFIALGVARAGSSAVDDDNPAYVSPYSWENLSRDENGRLSYSEDGQVVSRVGIDVSENQGDIDWNAVASDGIEFAFVRIGYRGYTEGGLWADARYADNLDGAEAAGLDVGVYFFSQATTVEEAQEEAEYVLSLLAGRYLAYPVVFDHEPVAAENGRANDLDDETVSACALAFCERVEEGGYSTMIYGNAADMARYSSDVTDGRAVWFAEYDVDAPTAQFDFSVWQYDNGGTVAGISTSVDLNILFETAPVTVS